MTRLALALGYLWSSPVTAAGLLLALLGGGRPARLHKGAIDVVAPQRGPLAWFFRRFRVSAFTWGATVVYAERRLLEADRLCTHERVHVKQFLVLGPLMAVAYPLSSLWQLLNRRHPYRDNWFERHARRWEGRGEG